MPTSDSADFGQCRLRTVGDGLEACMAGWQPACSRVCRSLAWTDGMETRPWRGGLAIRPIFSVSSFGLVGLQPGQTAEAVITNQRELATAGTSRAPTADRGTGWGMPLRRHKEGTHEGCPYGRDGAETPVYASVGPVKPGPPAATKPRLAPVAEGLTQKA